VSQSVTSDLSPADAVAMGAALVRYGRPPASMVIDTRLAQPIVGGDGAYLLQATPNLKPAVASFLGVDTPTVEVLNGAGVAGAAQATAERLTDLGYSVSRVGNADRTQGQTTLNARPASRAAAEGMARGLGLPTSRVSTAATLPSGVDVQVVVAADLRAP
jgi:LytR cell envelope-related transcriptional attenuator